MKKLKKTFSMLCMLIYLLICISTCTASGLQEDGCETDETDINAAIITEDFYNEETTVRTEEEKTENIEGAEEDETCEESSEEENVTIKTEEENPLQEGNDDEVIPVSAETEKVCEDNQDSDLQLQPDAEQEDQLNHEMYEKQDIMVESTQETDNEHESQNKPEETGELPDELNLVLYSKESITNVLTREKPFSLKTTDNYSRILTFTLTVPEENAVSIAIDESPVTLHKTENNNTFDAEIHYTFDYQLEKEKIYSIILTTEREGYIPFSLSIAEKNRAEKTEEPLEAEKGENEEVDEKEFDLDSNDEEMLSMGYCKAQVVKVNGADCFFNIESEEVFTHLDYGSVLWVKSSMDYEWAEIYEDEEDNVQYIKWDDILIILEKEDNEEQPNTFGEEIENIDESLPRSLRLSSSLNRINGFVEYGTMIELQAELINFRDEDEYKCQWQYSPDGEIFYDIAGANDLTYEYPVSEENFTYIWKFVVEIQD